MKKRLRFLGSRLLSALRLALGALLFTPVFALLVTRFIGDRKSV